MVSEFNKDEYDQLRMNLFQMKLNALIQKKVQAGIKVEKLKDDIIEYLQTINLEQVIDE